MSTRDPWCLGCKRSADGSWRCLSGDHQAGTRLQAGHASFSVHGHQRSSSPVAPALCTGLACLVSLRLCKVILLSTRAQSDALAKCGAGAGSHS